MTLDRRRIDALQRAAVAAGRPALYSAVASALRRLKARATLAKMRDALRGAWPGGKPGRFLDAEEAAVIGEALHRCSVAGELVGRLVTAAQVGRLRLPGAERALLAASPEETAITGLRIGDIFDQPPARALDYFRLLRPGTPLDAAWLEAHRRASFTLAVMMEDALLARAQEIIEAGIESGADIREVGLTLEAFGVTTENPQYAEMVFRTNAMDAFNTGRYDEVADDPDLAEDFPYWEYVNPDDERTSDEHRENLEGGVDGTPYYPAETSFDEVRGERVWNCRCRLGRWIHAIEARRLGLPLPEWQMQATAHVA